eukprot:COSAG01_NODE_29045_length_646_cov_5.063985_1_plen_121_part_01
MALGWLAPIPASGQWARFGLAGGQAASSQGWRSRLPRPHGRLRPALSQMPRHGSGELQQALLVPFEGAEEAPGGAGSSSPLPQAAAASPLSQVVGRARELAGRHVKSWHLKFALGMLAMQG